MIGAKLGVGSSMAHPEEYAELDREVEDGPASIGSEVAAEDACQEIANIQQCTANTY